MPAPAQAPAPAPRARAAPAPAPAPAPAHNITLLTIYIQEVQGYGAGFSVADVHLRVGVRVGVRVVGAGVGVGVGLRVGLQWHANDLKSEPLHSPPPLSPRALAAASILGEAAWRCKGEGAAMPMAKARFRRDEPGRRRQCAQAARQCRAWVVHACEPGQPKEA